MEVERDLVGHEYLRESNRIELGMGALDPLPVVAGTIPAWRRAELLLVGLILLFVTSLLPFAANYVLHHPDERHYTDGALLMLQTGDYCTPRTPEGNLRFHKPAVAYWLVAAGYRAFGIHPLTSRLPFLLAGAGVVAMTYLLAWRMYRRVEIAVLAAVLAMSHPIVIMSATRSIPDIVLCLFLTCAALGWAGILEDEQPHCLWYWALYLGTGLGVATKGLPALVFLAFGLAISVLNPWQPVGWRKLVHLPSMLIGSLIAVSWFALMWSLHGRAAADMFWQDQVGGRVAPDLLQQLAQIGEAFGVMALLYAPWSLCGLYRSGAWRQRVQAVFRTRSARLLGLWIVTFLILGGLTVKFSTRYLLPVLPLASVLLAALLYSADASALRRDFGRVLVILLVLFLIIAGVVAAVSCQQTPSLLQVAAYSAIVLVGLRSAYHGLNSDWLPRAVAVGVLLVIGQPLSFLALQHLVLPDQGTQIAQKLLDLELPGETSVQYVGKPALASKIRVCLKGVIPVRTIGERWDVAQAERSCGAVLLVSDNDAAAIDLTAYDVHLVSHGVRDLPVRELVSAVCTGQLQPYLANHRQQFIVAVARDSALPAVGSHSFLQTASANWRVDALPPRSPVTVLPSPITPRTAASSRCAASASPR